jgi:hypothetical protein
MERDVSGVSLVVAADDDDDDGDIVVVPADDPDSAVEADADAHGDADTDADADAGETACKYRFMRSRNEGFTLDTWTAFGVGLTAAVLLLLVVAWLGVAADGAGAVKPALAPVGGLCKGLKPRLLFGVVLVLVGR